MKNRIKIIQGDITRIEVDAIVNAANKGLYAGGGVCGAIHEAAGQELENECLQIGVCEIGEAVITGGYNLPARHVIHTVGPVWFGGIRKEVEKLTSCYYNSLKLADKHDLKRIAFPCISTGTYRFPKDEASKIALRTIKDHLMESQIEEVIIVAYTTEDFDHYQRELNSLYE